MASEIEDDENIIQPGSNIVLDVNGQKLAFIKVKEGATIRVGKVSCSIEPIIGAPFGAAFLLSQQGNLESALRNPHDEIAEAVQTDKTNANLVEGPNQKLTGAHIAELKADKHGDEIIAALQEGSSTFADKTAFSQEKWQQRKSKKYIHFVTARKPTSQLLCHVYFTASPNKVFNLRPDSLAIMMHHANVGPHARVLCIDACLGIVAAACAERMGGHGTLCCAHAEHKRYSLDAARLLNRPRWLARSARHATLQDLLQAAAAQPCDECAAAAAASQDASISNGGASEGAAASTAENATDGQGAESLAAGSNLQCNGSEQTGAAQAATTNEQARAQFVLGEGVPEGVKIPDGIMQARARDLQHICSAGFTSLVVAAPRIDYAQLMPLLLPLLLPSATFCLFGPALQPLAECYQALQDTKRFVALQLQESWCREIQVLPARTHPTMSMPGTGGYLLSGTCVLPPDEADRPAQAGAAKGPPRKRARSNGRR